MNNKLTDEQVENIIEMAADAAKRYGPQWDSALVGGVGGNFHAVTSDTIQAVVVQANDDSRDSSWLCDYLESVSPAVIQAALTELQEYRKAASQPIGWTDEQELRCVEKDGCGYLFTVNPVTPHADSRRVIKLYRLPEIE
ncbi:hypothetical protein DEO48_00715 [Enterobacter sp. CGMCC 5087]|uniref:hypothetical protein n=1 Tax=Enterobacter sp. CGMCC 5087 TaxID=2183878 RepID=UPI000D682219|nr:hypothetical protein [Enterobacter sp. CGMCC 5087]PWI82111.1 hypothetical protein DEO48_00715 [Enterobacter sp. CGMCC 5087]